MFTKAGDLIGRVAKRSGDPQGLFAAWVCRLWAEVIEETFPKAKASRAQIFRGGKLTIQVSSSTEAGELRLRSNILLARINTKIGRQAVKKLQFKIITS